MPRTFLCIILLLAACHSRKTYPPGGYPYPVCINDRDTGFYYLSLKDKMTKRDSFRHSWDSLLFKVYNEPNLSLKAMSSPVFRLYFTGHGQGSLVITLTPNQLTVKRHDQGHFAYMTDSRPARTLEVTLHRFNGDGIPSTERSGLVLAFNQKRISA
jgi:hypothetical protein